MRIYLDGSEGRKGDSPNAIVVFADNNNNTEKVFYKEVDTRRTGSYEVEKEALTFALNLIRIKGFNNVKLYSDNQSIVRDFQNHPELKGKARLSWIPRKENLADRWNNPNPFRQRKAWSQSRHRRPY